MKRNNPSESASARTTQRRGDVRRQQLLLAARVLLESRDSREITMVSVCAEAGIPHGSARHFYPELDELWRGLLAELGQQHDIELMRPLPSSCTRSWRALLACLIKRSARFQRENLAFAKLTIGGQMPSDLKRLDRDEDYNRSLFLLQQLERFFVVPEHKDNDRVIYFATEAVDTAFTLSMREKGRVTSWWVDRAIRGASAIVAEHFGELLPRESP